MQIHSMPDHLIRRLNQISVAIFLEKMAEAGLKLTPVQYAALCAIRANPGTDQATVAGLIAYDRATLGKVIDRLEARGLVRRDRSSTDRRAKTLHLSADGEKLCEAALPHVETAQPEILTGLSKKEQTEFMRLLEKVTMAGNEHSRAPMISPGNQSYSEPYKPHSGR